MSLFIHTDKTARRGKSRENVCPQRQCNFDYSEQHRRGTIVGGYGFAVGGWQTTLLANRQ